MEEIVCQVNNNGIVLPTEIIQQLKDQNVSAVRLFYQGRLSWDDENKEVIYSMENKEFVIPEEVFEEAGIEADEQLHVLVYDQAIVIATTAEVYRNISDDIKVLCKALEMSEEETVEAVLSGKIYQEEYEKSNL